MLKTESFVEISNNHLIMHLDDWLRKLTIYEQNKQNYCQSLEKVLLIYPTFSYRKWNS